MSCCSGMRSNGRTDGRGCGSAHEGPAGRRAVGGACESPGGGRGVSHVPPGPGGEGVSRWCGSGHRSRSCPPSTCRLVMKRPGFRSRMVVTSIKECCSSFASAGRHHRGQDPYPYQCTYKCCYM
jgi:hypothetical protein